jgi:hypothetical protein
MMGQREKDDFVHTHTHTHTHTFQNFLGGHFFERIPDFSGLGYYYYDRLVTSHSGIQGTYTHTNGAVRCGISSWLWVFTFQRNKTTHGNPSSLYIYIYS